MRVGVAGLGKMGSAIASRLVECGLDVTGWNRESAHVVELGLAAAESPAALAGACDIVVTSLFDDDAVNAVYRGGNGLVRGARGKLFIEMSTVRPQTQTALAADVGAAGGAFLECPVSGTTGPARQGQLVGLAGGEQGDLERARVVLDKLCRRIEHIGPVGAGATAKLAVNLPLIAFWQSFGEAMALMQPLHKDPEWLVNLFSDTAGTPAVMKVKASAITKTLGGKNEVEPTYDIDAMRKDLRLILAEHHLPCAATVLTALDQIAATGWGKRDCAWVPAYWSTHTD